MFLSFVLIGVSQNEPVDSLLQTCIKIYLTNNSYLNYNNSTDSAFVMFYDDFVASEMRRYSQSEPQLIFLTKNEAKEMVKKRKTLFVHLVSKEEMVNHSYRITICLMQGDIRRMRWWQPKRVWFGNTGVCSNFDIVNGKIHVCADNPNLTH